jgi:hypothetical protein
MKINMNRVIEDLEKMSPIQQDILAARLINSNASLAVAIATKINIAHQDKFYTDSVEVAYNGE